MIETKKGRRKATPSHLLATTLRLTSTVPFGNRGLRVGLGMLGRHEVTSDSATVLCNFLAHGLFLYVLNQTKKNQQQCPAELTQFVLTFPRGCLRVLQILLDFSFDQEGGKS